MTPNDFSITFRGGGKSSFIQLERTYQNQSTKISKEKDSLFSKCISLQVLYGMMSILGLNKDTTKVFFISFAIRFF